MAQDHSLEPKLPGDPERALEAEEGVRVRERAIDASLAQRTHAEVHEHGKQDDRDLPCRGNDPSPLPIRRSHHTFNLPCSQRAGIGRHAERPCAELPSEHGDNGRVSRRLRLDLEREAHRGRGETRRTSQ